MASVSSSEEVQSPFELLLEEATSFKAVVRASAWAELSMHSSKARFGEREPTNQNISPKLLLNEHYKRNIRDYKI